MQAGLRAWTQVLLGQADDKAEVDMDTDAPQVSHKPGGEPKIKVSFVGGFFVVFSLTVSYLMQELYLKLIWAINSFASSFGGIPAFSHLSAS